VTTSEGRVEGRRHDDLPDPLDRDAHWRYRPTRGSTHVLLVERDRTVVPLISEMLRAAWPDPLIFTHAERLDDVAQQLPTGPLTAILLGDPDISLLEQVRAVAPDLPVIVLAREYSDSSALAALRAGAQDYVSRDEFTPAELRRVLLHAIERKRAEAQLAHRALQDPLTGLPNRTLFMDRLGLALERVRRAGSLVALLFLDVDHFKRINDSLGHAAGDRVLTALAARLLSVLRPMDTVARFGGDEFVFLFEGLSAPSEAVSIAERVQEVASTPISLDGQLHSLSVSIGVATTADPETPPEMLIAQADGAMYEAKARGGTGTTVADLDHEPEELSIAEPVVSRGPGSSNGSDLAEQLRGAVERSELRVVYQPVYRFEGGRRVWGFEALVRWEHPERGLLSPGEFLPLAEEMGVVGAIGHFVLEEALSLLARLRASSSELTASVNWSHDQLGEPELAAAVEAIVAAGIDPRSLCVEIPERTVSENPDAAIRASEVMRAAGVRVAVDDYGTASTPLGDLRRLKADVLKIHESIVGELDSGSADGAVVGAVVDLAHALGMQVVGEGVETDEQLLGLQTLGADAAQGFLLCRPMRGDQLEELIMHAG
jgi:diguanylate cyclase (GGDEF)-like protein